MSGVRFSLRFYPEDPRQAQALRLLRAVPEGRRNAYIADCILACAEQTDWQTQLRRILREELAQTALQHSAESHETDAPQAALEFLASL